MADNFIFSSESVTEGHPDKVADQISDGVLDAILANDPMGRVACETLVSTGLVVVAGEISTKTSVDIPKIARSIINDIGYTRAKYGFDGETCAVLTAIDEQSGDIAQGVDNAIEVRDDSSIGEEDIAKTGAGDQGMMFGYSPFTRPREAALESAKGRDALLSQAGRENSGFITLREQESSSRRHNRSFNTARHFSSSRTDTR